MPKWNELPCQGCVVSCTIHTFGCVSTRDIVYLQCMMIGPASGGCIERTRRMNMSSGVAHSGTPWSGHAKNCSWRTSLRSEQPSYTRSTHHNTRHFHTFQLPTRLAPLSLQSHIIGAKYMYANSFISAVHRHICRLLENTPSQALQLSIEAHTGTPPAADWKCPPGRPRRTWLQQLVEEDICLSVGAAQIARQDRSMWRTLRPSAG